MLSITRRCFFAGAALAAVGPTIARFAPASPTDPTIGFGDSPDLPSAALLNSGEASSYLLVFHTGQEVMKGLLAFAKKHNLVSGHLTGIGALSGAEIGYFDPERSTYLHNQQNEQAELLSLTGNLALNANEPFFHVHVALGMRDGTARGGHLFAATVRPTVELVLTTFPGPVRWEIDRATGLPLLDP